MGSALEHSIDLTISDLKKSGGKVFVACSGGIDSMVLLNILSSAVRKAEFDSLEALHVNYGLRGAESDGDQSLVSKVCKELGIPLRVLDLRNQIPPTTGVQEWARDTRYRWIEGIINKNKDIVAIGHHQGDLAENVLFRLARGVSDNLSGMTVRSRYLWRPLLVVDRDWVSQYALRQKVPYREDSSNAKITYSRNRIRHNVIGELKDLFSGAERRIAETAQDIDEILAYIDKQMEPLFKQESLERKQIESTPAAIAKRVLAGFLTEQGAGDQLNRNLLDEIYHDLMDGSPFTKQLSGRLVVLSWL